MSDSERPADKILSALQERAKELNCLYEVEEALSHTELPLAEAFQAVVEAIPPGWQYPDVCEAAIHHDGQTYVSSDFEATEWVLRADLVVRGQVVGDVCVYYTEDRPRESIGPFLIEEQRLIDTIAERLAHFILFQELRGMRQEWEDASARVGTTQQDRWRGPIDLLRRSDKNLYLRAARKMLNHLCWTGVEGAQELLQEAFGRSQGPVSAGGEVNAPGRARGVDESVLLSGRPFELASREMPDDEILSLIETWITEDKASFLPKVLQNPRTSLGDVAESLDRFHHLLAGGAELSQSTMNGIRVGLIRRFLTDQLAFIMIAKSFLTTEDFASILAQVVLSAESHGKLGGKSAGLVLAERILRTAASEDDAVGTFKVPRSWYVPSELIMKFIAYNDLEEVLEQKYKPISQVRVEYPNVVQLFKNSRFPFDIVRSLSLVLDDVGDAPLIVRSSSLLEDRLGSAFSGKYKSLFLANQGPRTERLRALLDAITEVYASIFGPDPIEYRRERGLLDFHEEMAVLIQEVVGTRVGRYFMPAFAGVAFSRNEFRWSPRIRHSDGLVRLVPGLGTRAVDRVGDDYPILAVPGKPELRVNTTTDEIVRYSPRRIDVIDLETNAFVTLDLGELLRSCGTDYPAFSRVFSVLREGSLQQVSPMLADLEHDEPVADFAGLTDRTPFLRQIDATLKVLERTLDTPVDIEFAHDGEHLYLLQCRPQSASDDSAPTPIPKDVSLGDTLFRACRFVSNGWVPDITHVVYVDPDRYSALSGHAELVAVGEAVSRLNKLLPKRRFILMGPGRWGSRGDIRLGVSVTYSDINNTAMLLEIARKRGDYLPDLSFGTHFFQDLVEASIRYLPLYPDEDRGYLNEAFLLRSSNLLAEILPDLSWLADTVRVIDVPSSAGGRVLRVLMNAEVDEAVGLLADAAEPRTSVTPRMRSDRRPLPEEHWRWRARMAERIAASLDPGRFGVAAMYLIGSAKNASAGPQSDIDLVVHFRGGAEERRDLLSWLEGWSLCLGEVNYLRTGYWTPDILDVHLVSDEDIEQRTSFAAKIGAVTDAARPLSLAGSDAPERAL